MKAREKPSGAAWFPSTAAGVDYGADCSNWILEHLCQLELERCPGDHVAQHLHFTCNETKIQPG